MLQLFRGALAYLSLLSRGIELVLEMHLGSIELEVKITKFL